MSEALFQHSAGGIDLCCLGKKKKKKQQNARKLALHKRGGGESGRELPERDRSGGAEAERRQNREPEPERECRKMPRPDNEFRQKGAAEPVGAAIFQDEMNIQPGEEQREGEAGAAELPGEAYRSARRPEEQGQQQGQQDCGTTEPEAWMEMNLRKKQVAPETASGQKKTCGEEKHKNAGEPPNRFWYRSHESIPV
ncbi:MAG: hypothetical protein V8T87_13160 [Victivallales bacterium]